MLSWQAKKIVYVIWGRMAWSSIGRMTLTTYLLALGAVLGLCLLAMRFAIQPTRSCPRCTARVRVAARRCRRCGYRFTV